MYELWFKQILVELESVIAIIGAHTFAQKNLLTVVSHAKQGHSDYEGAFLSACSTLYLL